MESERKVLTAPDGARMVYYVGGNRRGAPVVLMHGWGCNHTTVKLIEQAVGATHCVYNVDFPGFGESPEPPDVWGVEAYTSLIELLISSENLDKPVLIGHSFGGRVALLTGSRKAYSKIVLVDAAGVKPHRSFYYYWKVYTYKFSKWLTRSLLGEQRARAIIEARLKKSASADYLNSSPRMRAILSKVVNEDLTSVMPLVKAPTLMIWGENDTATPLSDARLMERLIPGSGLVSFPGCGHYSFLDNPMQFTAVVRSFLNS